MRFVSRKGQGLVLAVTACAVVAAGCGSSSDDGEKASDQQTATTQAKALTGEPLKVMLIGSINGLGADFSQVKVGAQAAALQINDAGGVKGRPIEVEVCNDHVDVAQTIACARKAVSEKVLAVVGTYAAGNDFTEVLGKAGIPVIGAYQGGFIPLDGPAPLTSENSFPFVGGLTLMAVGMGALAGDQGFKKVNILARDAQGYLESTKALVNQGLTPRGGAVGKVVLMPLNTPDASPYVASALDGDPDAVVVISGPADVAKVISGVRQGGSKAALITASIMLPDASMKTLGAAADGVLVPMQFKPATLTDDPAVQRYVDGVDAIDGDAPKDDLSENAWAAVNAFAQVAATLPTITPATLTKAFADTTDLDTGLTAPIDFTTPIAAGPGFGRLFNDSFMYTKVSGGELKAIAPTFSSALRP